MNRVLIGACSAALASVAGLARADLTYGVEAGLGYSDNIQRVDTAETDEKIGTLGLDLSWFEDTQRLDADVLVDLSYFEYLDDTFDSEVIGVADGFVSLGIIPERFTWMIQDTYGQAQTDPFAPITPDNREDINFFTTGPDLTLRFGSAVSARMFGRYSVTTYEESPLDAERTSAGATLTYQLSQRSSTALSAVREQIDLDAAGSPDYDRDSAFVSYTLTGARTDIALDLGYTWVDPSDGEETGGLLADLSISRDLSESSTLRLEIGSHFSDAGESLRGALAGGAVGGADITASGDPFESRSAFLRWTFARNRTGASLGAGRYEDEYETQTLLDRTRTAYEASVSRRLTQDVEIEFVALLNDEEFENTGLTSEELNVLARCSWNFGRRMGLALSLERADRNTSDGVGEYTENRAFLTLTYGAGDIGPAAIRTSRPLL